MTTEGQSTVTPTGAAGVWRVRHHLEGHDVAVYLYPTGLWRCEKHPGRRDCTHIQAVKHAIERDMIGHAVKDVIARAREQAARARGGQP